MKKKFIRDISQNNEKHKIDRIKYFWIHKHHDNTLFKLLPNATKKAAIMANIINSVAREEFSEEDAELS